MHPLVVFLTFVQNIYIYLHLEDLRKFGIFFSSLLHENSIFATLGTSNKVTISSKKKRKGFKRFLI